MKRIFCLLLALLLICGGLAACKKDKGNDPVATAPENQQGEEDDNEYDKNGYLKDDLPNDVNYQGETVRVLGWTNTYGEYDIEVTDVKTEVESALYTRNVNVESRFGVSLRFETISGDYDTQDEFAATVKNSVFAENEMYDLIAAYSMCATVLARDGYLSDLTNLPYLNFEMPWWPSTLLENARIGDSLYYASGDISLAYLGSMFFLVVNNEMLAKYEISDVPSDDVLAGTWTMERMLEYTSGVYDDLNRNQMKDGADEFGLVIQSNVFLDGFIASCNLNFINISEDGVFSAGSDMTNISKGDDIINTLRTAFYSTDEALLDAGTDAVNAFIEGRALFISSHPQRLIATGGLEYAYGILPFPKYNTQQTQYYTNIGYTFSSYGILTQLQDKNRAALVMEALASEGYRNTTHTYYEENLKYRYASDDDVNVQMYDLIRSNPYFDPVRFLFKLLNDNGTNPAGIFRSNISNDSGTWSSKIGGILTNFNSYLEGLSSSFGELQS